MPINIVHRYDALNKCVLILDLKTSILKISYTFAGKVFQMCGPIDLKEP